MGITAGPGGWLMADTIFPPVLQCRGQIGRTPVWKAISRLDGAAILLQGATALTVDAQSWTKLAKAHNSKTKLIPSLEKGRKNASQPVALSPTKSRQAVARSPPLPDAQEDVIGAETRVL